MIRILFLTSVLSIASVSELFSQPEIKVSFTGKSPAIDGFVNDAVWVNAPVISELIQREPRSSHAM